MFQRRLAIGGVLALALVLFAAGAPASADTIPKPCEPNTTYSGVFVGTDDGNHGNLGTGAAFDPERMGKKLRDTCTGWADGSQDIIVESGAPNAAPASAKVNFDNGGVTKNKIRDAVNTHQINRNPGDEFIFYISAHGSTAGITLDGGVQLTWAELRDILSGTYSGMTSGGFEKSVTVTVVIDTCEAGAFAGAIAAGGGIKDRDGDPMDRNHLRVLMAAAAGCPAYAVYKGDNTNLEWYDDDGPPGPGPGTESCTGTANGTADGDAFNNANDPDCKGGVFSNYLQDHLAPLISSDTWYRYAYVDAVNAGWTATNLPLEYPGLIGGIAEVSDVDASALEATASGGSSGTTYAVIAGIVAGALMLGAGGWYARRRWLS